LISERHASWEVVCDCEVGGGQVNGKKKSPMCRSHETGRRLLGTSELPERMGELPRTNLTLLKRSVIQVKEKKGGPMSLSSATEEVERKLLWKQNCGQHSWPPGLRTQQQRTGRCQLGVREVQTGTSTGPATSVKWFKTKRQKKLSFPLG